MTPSRAITSGSSLSAPLALMAVLLPAGTGPCTAGAWDFVPSFGVDTAYRDNVEVVQAEGPAQSDTVIRAVASLPVARAWGTGSFALTYTPTYETYRDRTDLDQWDHMANLSVSESWTRRSGFSAGARWSSSENQGQLRPEDVADEAPLLVPRNRITRTSLNVGLNLAPRRRTGVALGGQWDSIDYGEPVEATAGVQESRRYKANVGLNWEGSRRVSYTVSYGIGRIEERVEKRTVTNLGLGLNARLSENLSLSAGAGAGRALAGAGGTQDQTVPTVNLTLNRSFSGDGSLSVGYVRGVGSSSGLGGVAVTSTYSLGYSRPFSRRWSGSVAANRTEREDVDEDLGIGLSTTAINVGVQVALSRTLGLALGAQRLKQDNAGPLSTEAESYRLGLRWQPAGWR